MARGPSEVTGFEADADLIHLLLDAVTEYAIYMLNPDGLVTSWNAGAEHLKGYGPTEILGQPYERFFTREDQLHNVPAHILATTKDAGRHESEGWRVRKDDVRFWASAILHKVQDKAGRHIGFVQVTRVLSCGVRLHCVSFQETRSGTSRSISAHEPPGGRPRVELRTCPSGRPWVQPKIVLV